MLFVDDDQAGVGQRREHRRARADQHPRLRRAPWPARRARARRRPGPNAAPAPARRAATRKRCSVCGVSPISGHQHQRLPAGGQAVADRLQVDLGLAAAGHALQQQGAEAAGRRAAPPAPRRCAGVERRRRRRPAPARCRSGKGTRSARPRRCSARAAARQPANSRVQRVLAGRAGAAAARAGAAAAHGRAAASAARPAAVSLPAVGERLGQRLAVAQGHGQGGGQHLARAARGSSGRRTAASPAVRSEQGRRVQDADGRAQRLDRRLGRRPSSRTTPMRSPRPNGTRTRRPTQSGRRCCAVGRQVVEQAWAAAPAGRRAARREGKAWQSLA